MDKAGFPTVPGSFTGQGCKRNDKGAGVETMMESSRTYLPAAGHDWSLPLYDPIVKLLGDDAARRALLEEAALRPGQRVLDVGCGTGTLAALIKQLYPDVEVVGLDPDPKALARARRKAARAGSPSSSIRDLETSFRILRRGSIAFSRRSCSTISSRTKKGRHCVRCGASSKPAASFTCSTSKAPRTARMASWLTCFTPAIA